MKKLIDCITFFDNNFMFEIRYKILNEFVDCFVICESKYDHQNNPKKINFKFQEFYDKSKIIHLVCDKKFPIDNTSWENQAYQREFLLNNLSIFDKEDYIFFSDPDEIPNPNILLNFELKKKFGIFKQKCFNFKFNLFNQYESPWEGTRVAMKKNIKSLDFMRQKIKSKNLNYKFYRIDKEKSIQLFEDGGWHFNNIMSPEDISLKLKTFAHIEFASKKFSDVDVIKKKISLGIDLFERGHKYKKVKIDETFPNYLRENTEKYKDFIIL